MRYITGVIFAAAAFLLVMRCMPDTGAIYTHDSQSYEYAASTLLESGEMRYFGYDTPIIQWPPFYILTVALMKLLGLPLARGAAWLNALAFAYLLYATAIFLWGHLRVKGLAIPGLFMMTASVPLLEVCGYAWSEMLFIFLSVLAALFMLRYFSSEQEGWFYASAVVSSLTWLTRYVGIVMIGVVALVLFIRMKPFITRVKKTFIYLFIACFPMALWVGRNYLLSGTFTGGRQPGEVTLQENIALSLEVFKNWASFKEPLFTYIAAAFFVFLVILSLTLKKESRKKASESVPAFLTCVLYLAGYAGMLLASATTAAMDPIGSRLWAPVFPFWILALIFLIDLVVGKIKTEKLKVWMTAGFTLFALVALINPVLWIQSEALPGKDARTGSMESAAIKNSPILALTNETLTPAEETLIISNQASILALHSEFKCYYPPKKKGLPLYGFDRYNERVENFGEIYLVWAGSSSSESFMDIAAFRERYEMEKIAQNEYGVIYKIR